VVKYSNETSVFHPSTFLMRHCFSDCGLQSCLCYTDEAASGLQTLLLVGSL